jgi:outer membrane usher protein FimD/PapC
MLPWSLRGYAPQITGLAQTNATVRLAWLTVSFTKATFRQGRLLFRI